MNKTVKKVGTKSYAFDSQAFGTGMWKEITSSGKLGKVAKKELQDILNDPNTQEVDGKVYAFDPKAFGTGMWKEVTSSGKLGKTAKKEIQQKLGNITQSNQKQDSSGQQAPTPGKSRIPNVDAIGQKISANAPKSYARSMFARGSFGFKAENVIRTKISRALGVDWDTKHPLLGAGEYSDYRGKRKKFKGSFESSQKSTASPFSPSYGTDSSLTATPETKSSSSIGGSSNKILSSIDKKINLSNGYLKTMSDQLSQIRSKLFDENTIAVKFSKNSDSAKNLSDISTNIKEIKESIKKMSDIEAAKSFGGGDDGSGGGFGLDLPDFGRRRGGGARGGAGGGARSRFRPRGRGLAGLAAGMAAAVGGSYLWDRFAGGGGAEDEEDSLEGATPITENGEVIGYMLEDGGIVAVPGMEDRLREYQARTRNMLNPGAEGGAPGPMPQAQSQNIPQETSIWDTIGEAGASLLGGLPGMRRGATTPPPTVPPASAPTPEVTNPPRAATTPGSSSRPVIDLEMNPRTGVYEAPKPQSWWEKIKGTASSLGDDALNLAKRGSQLFKGSGVAAGIGAGLDVAINEFTEIPQLEALKQDVFQKLQNGEITEQEAVEAIKKIDDKIWRSRGGSAARGALTGAAGAVGGTAGALAGGGVASVPLAIGGGVAASQGADWLLGDTVQRAGGWLGEKLFGGSDASAREQLKAIGNGMNPTSYSPPASTGGGGMQREIDRLNTEAAGRNISDTTNTGDDMSLDYTKYPETGRPPQAPQAEQVSQRPTSTGSRQQDYYNQMYNNLYDSAVRRGVTNPEVIAQLGASQTSLETGYGRSMAGNNAFGIKGVGTAGTTEAATQEFVNGQMINTRQGFRKYNTVEESADDYIDFLQKNPRYKDVLAASNIQDAIAAQGKTGYATDPDYAKKLQWISNKYGGEMPTQMASAVQQPNTQVPVTPVAPGFDLKNAPPTIPVPEQRTTGDAINQMGTQLAMAKDEAQGGGGATIINNNNTGGGGGGGMQQTHQAPMNIRNEENSLMRMQNGAAAYGLT